MSLETQRSRREINPTQGGTYKRDDQLDTFKRKLAHLDTEENEHADPAPATERKRRRTNLLTDTTNTDRVSDNDALKDITNTVYYDNIRKAGQIAQTGDTPQPIEPPTAVQQRMLNIGQQTYLALQLDQRQQERALQSQENEHAGRKVLGVITNRDVRPTYPLEKPLKREDDFSKERATQEVQEQLRQFKAKEEAQQQEQEKKAVTPAQNVMQPPQDTDPATKKPDTDNPNSDSPTNGLNSKLRDAEADLRDQPGNEMLAATVSELKAELSNARSKPSDSTRKIRT
jgi:hypothetical protein